MSIYVITRYNCEDHKEILMHIEGPENQEKLIEKLFADDLKARYAERDRIGSLTYKFAKEYSDTHPAPLMTTESFSKEHETEFVILTYMGKTHSDYDKALQVRAEWTSKYMKEKTVMREWECLRDIYISEQYEKLPKPETVNIDELLNFHGFKTLKVSEVIVTSY